VNSQNKQTVRPAGKLERPESLYDQKVRIAGKPELSEKPERPNCPSPIYWRNDKPATPLNKGPLDALLQLSSRSSFPVVPTFQSFQLSSHSSFPVVPAFRSFQLSGCSSFPVFPAFWSFQLSGRYSFPVVPAAFQ
jgi:hypothetical protein